MFMFCTPLVGRYEKPEGTTSGFMFLTTGDLMELLTKLLLVFYSILAAATAIQRLWNTISSLFK